MVKKRNNKIYLIVGLIVVLILGKFILSTASFIPFFFQLLFNKNIELKHTDNEINILLLGIGGENHEGPKLTDTVIFSSLNTKTNKITILSIPRDLYSPELKGKINGAYSEGEEKRKGGGLILSEAVVEKILNKNVDYGIVINFDGFVKAVDLLGGIDVEVKNTFDDYAYPITGKENELCGLQEEAIATLSAQIATGSATEADFFPCRFKHIHFNNGVQHMSGDTTLEFVRSRHALGPEGSDFARSARQEKVINAFKDKIFSLQVLTNPGKVINLYSILKGSIDTDIKDTEFDDFIRLLAKMKDAKIQSVVLDIGDSANLREGLLINPNPEEFGGAWVLIPRKGKDNFSEIQEYLNCVITQGKCTVSKFP
ncbi:MAG: hypothetical protein A2W22_05350 [Candidatus Levybacteria bacterium RBG_16_35_11]|nr:MAG: hypothetical protein A2W22_05350 [Candidatus Levybacteria bacterium RBG_16_35_11]